MTDSDQGLRFATIVAPDTQWTRTVADLDSGGWHAVLVPDTLWTASPFPALAAAAAVTSRLALRTWVVAAPLRTPAALVREVRALQELSGDRFELGIGTGRPDAEQEATRLGRPWGSTAERIALVEECAAAVRAEVTPEPPVVVTAAAPRMVRAAGRVAGAAGAPGGRIGLALAPTATEADLRAAADDARAAAGDGVRLTVQAHGIGDRIPEMLRRWSGTDAAALRDAGAAGLLPGDVDAACDTLLRWKAELGVDEVVVPGDLVEAAAPLVARLG